MSSALPRSDITRFSRIEPEFIVKAYLSCTTQKVSMIQLKRRLSTLLSVDTVAALVARLISSGQIIRDGNNLQLAHEGQKATRAALGIDAGKPWDSVRIGRLPVVALGVDPDNIETRRKLARADILGAAIVCVGYDLPKNNLLSPTGVRSELVWRILRAGVPDVIGQGPFPLIEKPNAVDRTIVAGLAGVRAKTISGAVAALAAKTINAERSKSDVLRRQLIRLALKKRSSPEGFAERVKVIAHALSTPPFQGRVAIAQVYDAYGRQYPDAGSLESFKHRLLAAAKAHELHLSRLDLPEHVNRELRTRSATPSGSDEVHFVVTEWT
jgi:hypothetical protein